MYGGVMLSSAHLHAALELRRERAASHARLAELRLAKLGALGLLEVVRRVRERRLKERALVVARPRRVDGRGGEREHTVRDRRHHCGVEEGGCELDGDGSATSAREVVNMTRSRQSARRVRRVQSELPRSAMGCERPKG